MPAPLRDSLRATLQKRITFGGAFGFGVAIFATVFVCALFVYLVYHTDYAATQYARSAADPSTSTPPQWPARLDKIAYNERMLALAHYSGTLAAGTASSTRTQPTWTATTTVSIPGQKWPTPTVYPEGGAILPFHRIVAFYGNFYSKKMGVLGEYPEQTVLAKLASTTEEWAKADPNTPVIPAIQYIAVVAQGAPGPDHMYRLRMPDSQINKALSMAVQVHGLLILDIQVGDSTLQKELPLLTKYLKLPNVELAIDPEFAMHNGRPPGLTVGTYDAKDINFAAHFLAGLVNEYHLPPKVLVVHRWTMGMVTNYQNITPLPQVEVVMDMDGWGSQAKKINTYDRVVAPYPVQFTGIKLFFHADLKPPSTGLLTTKQILALDPKPIYIQYQ